MDYRLSLMSGSDIPIPECNLILHQPTIKEIGLIGEESFFIGAQCLCINKSMYQDLENQEITNFALLQMLMQDERTKDKKEDIKSVLTLLFPDYQIFFTPRAISLNCKGESFTIDEGNFESLQSVLKKVFCLGAAGQESFNPANAKAKEIADKLMRARARVAAQKNEGAGSIFTQYISVLTVGLGSMSLQELLQLTMFQLYDLIERFMLYMNWDLDIRAKLAGGGSDSKTENWMKSIH